MILLLLACDAPSPVPGSSTDADADGAPDCDDADARVHQGATEVPYDGIDQDCDGEDLTDVDGDGDDPIALGGTDCDDTDPNVHIGATEVCNDQVDQDCDAGSDACEWPAERVATDLGTLWGPVGTWDLSVGVDVTGDGLGDLVTGGLYGTSVLPGPWAVEAAFDRRELVGAGFATGDVDGDGIGDVVIGSNTETLQVMFGPVTASSPQGVRVRDDAEYFGFDVDASGDLTGDGAVDLVATAGAAGPTGSFGAGLYVFEGPLTEDTDSSVAVGWIKSADEVYVANELVVPGDLDCDGVDELAFTLETRGGGPSACVTSRAAAGVATWRVAADQCWTGDVDRVARVGDLDGDGRADLLLGDCSASEAGVFLSLPGGWVEMDDADTTFEMGCEAAAGDLDGDGTADVALMDTAGMGRVSVVMGPIRRGSYAADEATHALVGDPDEELGSTVRVAAPEPGGVEDLFFTVFGDVARIPGVGD